MTKHSRASDKPSQKPSLQKPHFTVGWIALTIAVLYFLPALGIVNKSAFWAFSINAYLPLELMVTHAILVALVCIFLFKPGLLGFMQRIPTKFYYIFFACVFIFMAVFLREKVPFYGDGYFFQRDIVTNLPIKYAEVLTMLIYRAVYFALPESLRTGALVYRIVNTLSVIPALIILISSMHRVKHEYQPFLVLAFLGFGANVLFFGHVENYTLVYVTILLYLYVIAKPNVSLLFLAFLLAISICLHLVAIFLIPSFFYVLWRKRGQRTNMRLILTAIIFFLLPFIFTTLFSFVAGMTPGQLYIEIAASFSTLFEHTGQGYFQAILNIRHWLDIVNLLFLGLPIFPIVAFLIFKPIDGKSSWRNSHIQLILFLAVPFILFVVFFNTPLGLARDWDIGVTALAWRVAAILYLAKEIAPKFRVKSFLTSLGLLAFLLSLPWLVIHRFPKYGARRFEDIVGARTELYGTAYGYEILGRFYHDAEDYQNSVRNYEKAAQYDQLNWRRHYSVAMEYLNLKDSERALKNLRKARELKPDEAMILMELGLLYRTTGQTDSALIMFKKLYQQDTTDVMHFHNLGCAYYWAGQYKAAQDVFIDILREHPDHYNATIGLVDAMLATGDSAEAKHLIERLESKHGRNQTTSRYRKMLLGK